MITELMIADAMIDRVMEGRDPDEVFTHSLEEVSQTWHPGEISIATTTGKETVPGLLRGFWGIHAGAKGTDKKDWTLTHLESGLRFAGGLPSEKKAKDFVAALMLKFPELENTRTGAEVTALAKSRGRELATAVRELQSEITKRRVPKARPATKLLGVEVGTDSVALLSRLQQLKKDWEEQRSDMIAKAERSGVLRKRPTFTGGTRTDVDSSRPGAGDFESFLMWINGQIKDIERVISYPQILDAKVAKGFDKAQGIIDKRAKLLSKVFADIVVTTDEYLVHYVDVNGTITKEVDGKWAETFGKNNEGVRVKARSAHDAEVEVAHRAGILAAYVSATKVS